MARIVERFGMPPLWDREPGYPTLVQIILEQQVSLSSARAAYGRLIEATGVLTPERLLCLDDAELRRIGFSRQKALYCRELARAVCEGKLRAEALADMDDEAARVALLSMKGVGAWTADIYLLMALGRPDIWPSGDRALAVTAQEVKALPTCPTPAQLDQMAKAWRPWRAVAARLLWHYYLSRKSA